VVAVAAAAAAADRWACDRLLVEGGTVKKHKLSLNRETLVTLDRAQLTAVHGGGDVSRSICISNNGGGRSCTWCPGPDPPPIQNGGSGW
jgi:hypothetical protein